MNDSLHPREKQVKQMNKTLLQREDQVQHIAKACFSVKSLESR